MRWAMSRACKVSKWGHSGVLVWLYGLGMEIDVICVSFCGVRLSFCRVRGAFEPVHWFCGCVIAVDSMLPRCRSGGEHTSLRCCALLTESVCSSGVLFHWLALSHPLPTSRSSAQPDLPIFTTVLHIFRFGCSSLNRLEHGD